MHPKEPGKLSTTTTKASSNAQSNNMNNNTMTNSGFVPLPDDSARNYAVYNPNNNDRIRTASAELLQDALKGPITIPNGHINGHTATGNANTNEHIVYRLVLTGGKH